MKPSETPALKMSRKSARITAWRIFWLLLIIAMVMNACLTLIAYFATERLYRRDAALLAQMVARSLEAPLSRAAAYDIPLKLIPDGQRYLQSILASTPTLARIVVKDTSSAVIYSAEDRSRLTTAFLSAETAVLGRNGPVARVEATASLNEAARPFVLAFLGQTGAALVVAVMAAILAFRSALVSITLPRMQALATLDRVVQGDIVPTLENRPGRDWIDFWGAFRSRTTAVHQRWTDLVAFAQELETSDYENRNQLEIKRLLHRLSATYRLNDPHQSPDGKGGN